MDETETDAQFAAMGETEVHFLAYNQWSGRIRGDALSWLERQAQSRRDRDFASQAEQSRIARTAKTAAVVAAIAASIAVPLAILSTAISVLAWRYPREPNRPAAVSASTPSPTILDGR